MNHDCLEHGNRNQTVWIIYCWWPHLKHSMSSTLLLLDFFCNVFSLNKIFKTIDRSASKNFEPFVIECHQWRRSDGNSKFLSVIRINLHPRLPALLFHTLVLLHHHVSILFNSFRVSGRNLHEKPFLFRFASAPLKLCYHSLLPEPAPPTAAKLQIQTNVARWVLHNNGMKVLCSFATN